MAGAQPRAERSIATNGVPVATPWPDARTRLAEARTYWPATAWPDGRPQVVPLFGAG
jgi:hypothetical protein